MGRGLNWEEREGKEWRGEEIVGVVLLHRMVG